MSFIHALIIPAVINIAGTPVPITAFEGVPKLIADVAAKKPTEVIAADMLPIMETVSNYFLPGSGIAESILIMALSKSRPMTFDEQQAWMSRMGIETQR